jgi:hypothetical protein
MTTRQRSSSRNANNRTQSIVPAEEIDSNEPTGNQINLTTTTSANQLNLNSSSEMDIQGITSAEQIRSKIEFFNQKLLTDLSVTQATMIEEKIQILEIRLRAIRRSSDLENNSNTQYRFPTNIPLFDLDNTDIKNYLDTIETKSRIKNLPESEYIKVLLDNVKIDSEPYDFIRNDLLDRNLNWKNCRDLFYNRFKAFDIKTKNLDYIISFKFLENEKIDAARSRYSKLIFNSCLSFENPLVIRTFIKALPSNVQKTFNILVKNTEDLNWNNTIEFAKKAEQIENDTINPCNSLTPTVISSETKSIPKESNISNDERNEIVNLIKNFSKKFFQNNRFKKNRFKSNKICKFFENDNCKYGDKCKFFHGKKEDESSVHA